MAVRRGDVEGARALLRAGADVGAKDVYGVPVILWAAANGNAGMIKTLLAAGADVRNKGSSGRRALLHYLRGRTYSEPADVEVVRALVKAGADVNAADRNGVNVLRFAEQFGNAELMGLLRKAGARAK